MRAAVAHPRLMTPQQAAEEQSILFAVAMDAAIGVVFVATGILGGSLTLIAETIRLWLMLGIEIFALVIMRRIHRGTLTGLDFGTGKLEQLANVLIGFGMLGGALWVGLGVVEIVVGRSEVGTPLGLALAAIFGSVNTLINVVAWDGMRRTLAGGPSLLMLGQLQSRLVKLVSSLFVQLTMTVAAVATDDMVVIWADAIGSLFVAVIMFVNAFQMLRASLPDILDQSAGEDVRTAVQRVLASHAGTGSEVKRVRSRRSGKLVFVEVAMGFDGAASIAEIDRRIEAIKSAIRRDMENVEISIQVSSRKAA
jgi:divalent metal cation (Fe/Co/Zn/Cd) transporter